MGYKHRRKKQNKILTCALFMRIIKGEVKMKRRHLIKELKKAGFYLKRHGGNHDIYTNGIRNEPISHTREIDEILANKILKRNGIK